MQDPGIAGAQQLDEKLECHRIRQNWFEVEGYVYYIYIHIILWLHTYSGTLRFHCWCWDTTKQIHTNPLYVLLKPIIINPSWKFNNSHQKISMFLLIYSMGFWCFVFFLLHIIHRSIDRSLPIWPWALMCHPSSARWWWCGTPGRLGIRVCQKRCGKHAVNMPNPAEWGAQWCSWGATLVEIERSWKGTLEHLEHWEGKYCVVIVC